jgi:hypothetical protein
MPPKQITAKCGNCTKVVSDQCKGVMCQICCHWYHNTCQNLSDEQYEALNDYKDTFHWFCESCSVGCDKIFLLIKTLQNKIDKLEIEVSKIRKEKNEEKIENFKSEMICVLDQKLEEVNEKIENQLSIADHKMEEVKDKLAQQATAQESTSTLWSDIVNKEVDSKFTKVLEDVTKVQNNINITKQLLEEHKDKENRSNNIIIYNNPEIRTENKDEWFKNEKSFCLKFFNESLNVEVAEEDLGKITRLGKRTDDNLSRPMLIQLKDKSQKNKIMQSLSKLRQADESIKKIIVSHDMTVKEREECKKLVSEAKTKEAESSNQGEWIYRVRGPPGQMAIVKIKRKIY